MQRALVFAVLALSAVCAQAGFSGDGTAYSGDGQKDNTGKNACGFGGIGDQWEKFYCALPHGQFESGHCGKCVKVCGSDGCTVAKVVDACASCGHGDIDLSKRALKEATGFEWDRKRVSWEFVSCSDSGSGSGPSKPSKKCKGKKCKVSKKCKSGRKGKKCRKGRNLHEDELDTIFA